MQTFEKIKTSRLDKVLEIAGKRPRYGSTEHFGFWISVQVFNDKHRYIRMPDESVRRPARQSFKIRKAEPPGVQGGGISLDNVAVPRM